MKNDNPLSENGRRIRVVRDLGRILFLQIAAVAAVLLGFLLSYHPIPDTPAWDGVNTMCRVLLIVGVAAFLVATCWGGVKYRSVDFVPVPVRIYAVSLSGGIPLLVLFLLGQIYSKANIILLTPVLIVLIPVYCIVPQIFIRQYLKQNQNRKKEK